MTEMLTTMLLTQRVAALEAQLRTIEDFLAGKKEGHPLRENPTPHTPALPRDAGSHPPWGHPSLPGTGEVTSPEAARAKWLKDWMEKAREAEKKDPWKPPFGGPHYDPKLRGEIFLGALTDARVHSENVPQGLTCRDVVGPLGKVVREWIKFPGDVQAFEATDDTAEFAQKNTVIGSVNIGKKHDGLCWRNSHGDCGC